MRRPSRRLRVAISRGRGGIGGVLIAVGAAAVEDITKLTDRKSGRSISSGKPTYR
jgi:hypothetical protein